MINFTEKFFNLKLLKLSDILLHEATESNRLRNIYSRLANSKHLMNPVIVGRYNGQNILIDGANRFSSLEEIGCKLILAQIIDYKSKNIELLSWNHLIYNLPMSEIENFCNERGLKHSYIKHASAKKEHKNSLNRVIASDIKNGRSILIELPKNFFDLINTLAELTHVYFKKYPFDRSESEISYNDLRKYSRREGVLLEFPRFEKKHIIKIARSDLKLPAGISRHILDTRVLHVKYEIEKLKDDKNLSDKEVDLKQMLLNKIDKNKVRQYKESVIVFDE